MKISIVGATGVLGNQVIPRLIERGHEVRAVVRTLDQAIRMRHLNVQTFIGDILDRASLIPALKDTDCVLHLATAIPKDIVHGDWTMNDRIRREGTMNLLQCALECNTRRYIQQSIILLYGDYGQEIVDESTALQPMPYIQSAFDMEQQVKSSDLDWCILRGGLFYGPTTGTEDGWRRRARAGQLQIPKHKNALISLVHVIDMSSAVVLAAEFATAKSIYNVVDDYPVSYDELFTFVTRQIGVSEPEVGQVDMLSLGCSNHRITDDLGWRPAFSSFRSGLSLLTESYR